ncbi:MAG: amidohydrolase family protein [Proteobacteria bacterium]|nr:amidohydrolase family protein [Pseudomonadota bacterium]
MAQSIPRLQAESCRSPPVGIREVAALTPDIAPPAARPRRPRSKPPAGACDCHSHIFGPNARFLYAPERSYTPHEMPLETYLGMLDAIGIERGILVQGSAYGTDNSALLDALCKVPERLRGVAVVDEANSAGELKRMADAGVRGLRFNHLFRNGKLAFKGGAGIDRFAQLERTMADLGWHAQLWIDCKDLPELWPRIHNSPVPIVIDHMGRVDATLGSAYAGFEFMRRLLAEGKIWVKLSAPYRASNSPPHYPEVRPLHQALLSANPEQCLWGLNWPHVSWTEAMPNDGALLDLFEDWTPQANIRRQVLVDNPAKLFGFN